MTRPLGDSAAERARATARQRAYRRRLRTGDVVAPVPVSHAIVGALLDLGWLCESEAEDRQQVGRAIAAMLGDLAAAMRKNG